MNTLPLNNDVTALPAGHPLKLMQQENIGLAKLLDDLAAAATDGDATAVCAHLQKCYQLYSHYGKKDTVLVPVLYTYGVTGPGQIMWDMDDAIKDELSAIYRPLQEDAANLPLYQGRLQKLCQDISAMIAKEEQIVFNQCLRLFTDTQWYQIYGDFAEFAPAFDVQPSPWEPAAAWLAAQQATVDSEDILSSTITLPTGTCTIGELRRILALLPLDITFIDAQGRLRFFSNEGHIFDRPKVVLGQDIMNCHPPRIIPVVQNLLADFRAHKRDHLTVARRIKGRPIMVTYRAVYDTAGTYIGTVEFVQDCQDILDKFK